MPDVSISRDDDDMRAQLPRLARRLARATAALADGDESAADDISHLLRLLVARGKGDDVIRRVVRRWGLSEPQLRVSRPPARAGDVWYAFGNIPTGDEGEAVVSFSQWMLNDCLVMDGLQRSHFDWGGLVTAMANTNGSHLSQSIPEVLATVRVNVVAGMGLGSFMMWAGAQGAMLALRDVLEQLGDDTDIAVPDMPVSMHSASVTRGANGLDLVVGGLSYTGTEDVIVLSGRHPDAGSWYRLVYRPDPPPEMTDAPGWHP